jgi:23S rRNA (adenine2503-C2)-methyltransferase
MHVVAPAAAGPVPAAGATLSNLFGLSRQELQRLMDELGEPAYRADQLYAWLYAKRVRSLSEMTDLGKALRQKLEARHELRWPAVAERSFSTDGTIKLLFRLDDGATIESVYIPEKRRRTICISTQAGCPLRCGFCLTGISGYKRNLKVWEILGQVATVMAEAPQQDAHLAWNIVVMGMGEPLLNTQATLPALRVLMDKEGFAVAPRRLTLSTVGILPGLKKLMEEPVRPNLALSLHAPNQELRAKLMPIEDKYPLPEVIEAVQAYPIPRGGLVTYEYVLLREVNDTPAHARELVKLIRGSRAKVNLIPLNATPEIPFLPPTPEAVDRFCGILAEAKVVVSVRRQRGQDILAACGQLHLKRGAPAGAAAAATP